MVEDFATPHSQPDRRADAPTQPTVLVAGAASRVGPAIVAALRDEGVRVVAVTHHPSALRIPGVEILVADLSTAEDSAALANRVAAERPDVASLVCLVSGFSGGAYIQPDDGDWRDAVDLNAGAASAFIRAMLPRLVERGHGRVVTVVTRPSLDIAPTSIAHDSTRSSMVGLARSLAATLPGNGVTVNCLLPEIGSPSDPSIDPLAARMLTQVIAFLLSERSAAVQGADIPLRLT